MNEAVFVRPRAGRVVATAWVRPRRVLAVCDVLALALAVSFTPALASWRGVPPGSLHLANLLFSIIVASTLLFLMAVGRQYSSDRRISRLYDSVALLKSALVAYLFALGVAVVTDGYFAGVGNYSLAVIALHVAILLGSLILVRYALWAYQLRLFQGGAGLRRVLIAGSGSAAVEFLGFLRDRWWLGLRAVGTLATDETRPQGEALAVPLIGGVRSVGEEFDAAGADEVIVALDPPERVAFPRLAKALAQAHIPFRIVPSLFEESYRPAKLAGLDGVPVLGMTFVRRERVEREVKRFCDQLMALAALIVTAPLVVVVALAIKLTSRGPVLYRQQRVGHNGRTFTMYKFRTMAEDAEARLEELLTCNEADGCLFKMREDPRVTAIGRWLRRHSLDELPQFWNVLRGDMSVVGPRPPLPWEVDLYEPAHLRRLTAKPGITGLWQVSGRSDVGFEDMVSMDCRYIRDWSLGLDFSILLKTVAVVLKGEGAY